jgi:hypothetical protein
MSPETRNLSSNIEIIIYIVFRKQYGNHSVVRKKEYWRNHCPVFDRQEKEKNIATIQSSENDYTNHCMHVLSGKLVSRVCKQLNHWLIDKQADTKSEWKTRRPSLCVCLSFDRPSVFRPTERIITPLNHGSRQDMDWRPWRVQVQRPARSQCRRRRPNVMAQIPSNNFLDLCCLGCSL